MRHSRVPCIVMYGETQFRPISLRILDQDFLATQGRAWVIINLLYNSQIE